MIQNSAVVVCSYILGGCAGVAGSVLGTLTSTMISFTIETYTDFLIMWRGYRYSTAIVAGTHCAFLTMRGYNEYEIYTVLPGMCYNYCSRIVY